MAAAYAAGIVSTSAVGGPLPPRTAALFNDAAAATSSVTADRLDAPTLVVATGGATAALGWTPTVDAYAAGYRVYRSTSSGGSYAQVGTVTPVAATGGFDAPTVDGTYWYTVRAYSTTWESADSAAVSAAVRMGLTGFRPCTAQAPDTGGDANGFESSAASGCAVDGSVATDLNSGTGTGTSCTGSGKDRHRFQGFGLGVPASPTAILGIAVRVKLGLDLLSGTNKVCGQLSWDAGTTWTTAAESAITATALTTYTLGGAASLWGRTWTGTQLSDANFRVRLIDVSNNNARDFTLDGVEVQVTYTP